MCIRNLLHSMAIVGRPSPPIVVIAMPQRIIRFEQFVDGEKHDFVFVSHNSSILPSLFI